MKKTIFLAIALAVICSCDKNQVVDNPVPAGSNDTAIGFDADVAGTQTKSEGIESFQFASEETGNGYAASLEVMPIGFMPATKGTINTGANETTRQTLIDNGFWVDGYLDPESAGKYDDPDLDPTTYQFFAGAKTSFNAALTDCVHGTHNDGHWQFSGSKPQWRENSLHHFWAYYPQQEFTNEAYNAASFEYTSAGDKDLVIAHHSQLWSKHAGEKHGTSDELSCLYFKHPLSAVKLTKNFTFLAATDASETNYAATDRIEVIDFDMLGYNSGSCAVSGYGDGIGFSWTPNSGDGATRVEICNADKTAYVIPQATDKVIVPIGVLDHGTGVYYDDTWELPVNFASGSVTSWNAGYYYNYTYKATFKGPYVDPDKPAVYDPGFVGMSPQAATPVGTLNFSYIKDLTIKWKNLPVCNNHKQEVYVVIAPYQIPIVDPRPTDGRPNIDLTKLPEVSNPSQSDFADLVLGDDETVLFYTTLDNGPNIFGHLSNNADVRANVDVKWGVVNSGDDFTVDFVEVKENDEITKSQYSSSQYGVKISIDAEELGLEGRQYIYLLYREGSEGKDKTLWGIIDLSVTIDSRR